MTDRFIIDDAGTLIDIETRDTYDYVSEVLPLLNELENEKTRYETLAKHRRTEIIRRVATLQNIVAQYTSGEILFKNDVNPNTAVKQVLEKLLNTQIGEGLE